MQLQQPSTSSYRKRQHYDRTTMKVFNETKEIHYTTHHNWSWVVKHALEKLIKIEGQPNATKLCFCERFRELPSTQSEQSKEKPLYALFRLDLTWNIGPKLTKVRTKSDIFGFLDPKDSLTRMAQLSGAINCMPSTLLIPWNWLTSSAVSLGGEEQVDDELRTIIVNMLSSGPKLLKAPLGSGGFGLYFVYSCTDVEEIIRCHRKKAEEKDGFLQDLCNTFYGFNTNSELAWSLQDVVSGVRVRSPLQSDGDHLRTGQSPIVAEIERRRCQVRAYVVMVNGALYLYTTYEVRLPCWNIDLDATLAAEHAMYNTNKRVVASSGDVHQVGVREAGESTFSANWSDELENEYCGLGHGRPYNEHRNKGQTERYLLSELPELQGCESAVTDCMVELFTKMKPVLLHRQRTSASQSGTKPSKDGLGHIFDAEAIIKALESAHLRGTEEEAVPADGQQCTRADVVIVGVDLVLNCTTNTVAGEEPARSFSAKIVEINNNPAMPAEGKNMSALYREHLVSFVGSTIALAVAATAPQVPADPAVTSRFYKI